MPHWLRALTVSTHGYLGYWHEEKLEGCVSLGKVPSLGLILTASLKSCEDSLSCQCTLS